MLTSVRLSSASISTVVPKSSESQGELAKMVQPFSAIPGPKPFPVLRNLLEFRKNLLVLDQYLEECSKKYGDIFKLEAPG